MIYIHFTNGNISCKGGFSHQHDKYIGLIKTPNTKTNMNYLYITNLDPPRAENKLPQRHQKA
ncbi:hypothetical protein D1BOALGB6SA_4370 [Olavius sp. associated proteobacterium Delta 1]|nr:hypothetical protein D1BOALGB6SA_4370 [Olavius sp. associated proteobacterium Delta 1]